MEFIRELISERWIKVRVVEFISQSKQKDLVIPQGELLSVTLFLVEINSILDNGVDRSFFADDLAIYITTINQRVASRAGMVNH